MSNSILVVSPHPDDEAIGCGGTIASHAACGDRITVLFLTSGEQGGHGMPADQTARVREREAERAGTILGVHDQHFWRLPDGAVRATRDKVLRLAEFVAATAPDRIYLPYIRDDHADHRAAARMVQRAASLQADERSASLLMYEVWTPVARIDDIIDITAQMPIKLAAIRAYRSQCRVLRFDQAMQGLNCYRAEMYLWPKPSAQGPHYAEVFEETRP